MNYQFWATIPFSALLLPFILNVENPKTQGILVIIQLALFGVQTIALVMQLYNSFS